MKISAIASGSNGNAILLQNSNTTLLVDVGLSKKKILDGFTYFEQDINKVDGILITHEHSDHIKGLGVLLRAYNIPVYATKGTISYIKECSSLGNIDVSLFNEIKADESFAIKDIHITPLEISHDAREPVCYRFDDEEKSAAIVTDLGYYNEYLVNNLKELDGILLESNHDIYMLQTGPYPYHLKQRIWGNKGHLSNETCGYFINEIISDRLKHIMLGHLSQENNMPLLAYEAVRNEINFCDNEYCAENINIQVAKRTKPSTIIEL